jgi:hypothetical protein
MEIVTDGVLAAGLSILPGESSCDNVGRFEVVPADVLGQIVPAVRLNMVSIMGTY